MRVLIVALCTGSLACSIPTTSRYVMPSKDPKAVADATVVAAQRLGLERGPKDGETAHQFAVPLGLGDPRTTIDIDVASDGTLYLTQWQPEMHDVSTVNPDLRLPLLTSGLLAQGTRQVLAPELTPSDARPASPRWIPASLALDLLLPSAGSFYALRGTPQVPLYSFWMDFGARTMLDALAAIFLIESIALGPASSGGTWSLVVEAIIYLGVNRVLSMIGDAMAIHRRNRLAESGFSFTNGGEIAPWH